MLTCGDGVADVDLARLLEFHRVARQAGDDDRGAAAGRFGHIELDGDRSSSSPRSRRSARAGSTAGSSCSSRRCSTTSTATTQLRKEPLERLAADGQLMAYQHDGFWQCMDTLRDKIYLQHLWDSGTAPWKVWRT